MKVDIIGRGKVGRHFHSFLSSLPEEAGIDSRLVDSRSLEGGRENADLSLIAVSDTAIPSVARALGNRTGIIAHVSGSTPLSALRPDKAAVFYPFQSFAEGVDVDFADVPFMVEATDEETREILFNFASSLGSRAYDCDGTLRRELHLSGVLACNFVNELISLAQERLESHGLPPSLLNPLVRMTIDKALSKGASNVRTGPALRRDLKTLEAHREMLAESPDLQQVYNLLSALIISRSEPK